jgi:hypothetical protein
MNMRNQYAAAKIPTPTPSAIAMQIVLFKVILIGRPCSQQLF